jgi:hypothetical protein
VGRLALEAFLFLPLENYLFMDSKVLYSTGTGYSIAEPPPSFFFILLCRAFL